MLDDARVERYSRQILLPEVGGRGQERLCASHVSVAGDGPAAEMAAALLAAAGVGVTRHGGEPGTLVVETGDGGTVVGRTGGDAAVVVALVGRPCPRCAPDDPFDLPERPHPRDASAAFAQAVGALVAAEALRVLLGLATTGRRHRLDELRGTFDGRPLPAGEGCPDCAGAA
jgi:hypothetical protein